MTEQRKQEFFVSLKQKQASERIAVQWVERLMEPHIPSSLLEEGAQYLEPRHYNNLIEERFIEKLCGWPLCNHVLMNIPKAKYHISMKQRKVLDITERKKFCSPDCYRASNFFTSQLSTEPLWMRKEGSEVVVQKQVEVPRQEPVEEEIKSGANDQPDLMLKLLHQSVQRTDIKPRSDDEIIVIEKMSKVYIKDEDASDSDDMEEPEEKDYFKSEEKVTITKTISNDGGLESTTCKLWDAFSSWLTAESLVWIKQYRKEKRCVTNKVSQKEEKEELDIQRHPQDKVVLLPLVHNAETNQIQRNIFLRQLKTNLSPLAYQMDLDAHLLLPDILALSRTFRLSKDSIMFKPSEWKVLICVLIMGLELAEVQQMEPLRKWLRDVDLTLQDFSEFVKLLETQ